MDLMKLVGFTKLLSSTVAMSVQSISSPIPIQHPCTEHADIYLHFVNKYAKFVMLLSFILRQHPTLLTFYQRASNSIPRFVLQSSYQQSHQFDCTCLFSIYYLSAIAQDFSLAVACLLDLTWIVPFIYYQSSSYISTLCILDCNLFEPIQALIQ